MSSSPAYAKHPDHEITVKPFQGRVTVETKDGRTLVDTRAAGDASYFSIGDDAELANAVWTYETPFDEVADIKEALAFYPNKVIIKATPE